MFRRRIRREELASKRVAAQQAREITQLKTKQVELEKTLRLMIDASDDLLVDLHRSEHERKAAQARPGFAEAWLHSESPSAEVDDFFTVSQVDLRARRWLLASN